MAICVPGFATAASLGISITFQNIFLTGLPLFFGYLDKDRSVKEYNQSIFWVIFISCFSGILTLFLIFVDIKNGGVLNLPENDPRVKEMREEMGRRFEEGEMGEGEYRSIGGSGKSSKGFGEGGIDDGGFFVGD